MRVAVKVDLGDFERRLDDAAASILLASTRTANRLIERAKTSGFREVARIYGIGPRAFEQYARIRLAKDDAEASIEVRGKGLPVFHFDPRQTSKGVSVKIKGKRVLIPHAFLARMKSGHPGVFARGAYGGKGVRVATGRKFGRFVFGRRRLPINEIFTFAPPDAFQSEEVVRAMSDRVDEDYAKVLQAELAFALRK